MRNDSLQFRCQPVYLRVENVDTPFTAGCEPGQVLKIPISHGDGSYYADPETLATLEDGAAWSFATRRPTASSRRKPTPTAR